jgi:hypothetical protein
MKKFTANPNANTNGTSLQARSVTTTPRFMREHFGKCHQESLETDKGYHDGEWYFTDEEGHDYAVYFRFGECKIGAKNEHKMGAIALVRYLEGTT